MLKNGRVSGLLILCLLCIACSTGQPAAQRMAALPEAPVSSEVEGGELQSRMVIYHAEIKIEVEIPDKTVELLPDIAAGYEGYVVRLDPERSVLRVRADRLQEAVTEISALGKVRKRSVTGDDVSDRYVDFQIRLENARRSRDRYLELLAAAEHVEAALKVEKELERLNGEIDALEGRLRQMAHLTDFSTVTIYLEERIKPGILGYLFYGLYAGVRWLFIRN